VVSLKHGGEWAEEIRRCGIPVVELHRCRRFQPSRLLGLWRAIRSFRPRLLVTFMFTASTYGRILALLGGVPHRVCCERGGDLKTPGRVCVERLLARVTDAVVYNSKRNEASGKASGIRARTLTIYNGVELTPPNPAEGDRLLRHLGVPPGATLVGKVGQLHPRKDYPLFLEVAKRLAARPDLHFLIIGDGPERGRLERGVETLGLAGRVTFTGQLADPLPLVARLRVKLVTSLREGMSNALMEAMALGVPCVVSAAGANDELITDGVEGYVVKDRDPAIFARQVGALLDDPLLWQRLSENARRRAAGQLSVTRMVHSYEELFTQILSDAS